MIPSPASSSAQGVFVEYMGQTFPINILDGYRIDQDLDLSMVDDGPLPVGAEISVFGIDVWGERVGELTRVVRESIEEPRIHTIDSTDTEIYITPSDGLTDIALFADGEFLGRAYAYYFIDRHVLALDEPLAPGTHVEAFHYEPQRWDQYDAYSGNRRSRIADFIVQENVPERQVGIPARDLWVVGEYTYPPRQWEEGLSGWQDYNPYVPHSPEPVSPSVGALTDQDIEISGEYSTEYALVGVRMDTDEVIYVENRRGEDPQSASFTAQLDEPLPAGTQVAWYMVTWHDIDREADWMDDRMYWWYEGSVRASEPTIVTVEATQTIPAPEVDPITEDSESITGTVEEPELPVIVEIDGEPNEVETDEEGNFEFPLEEPLPEGTEVVVVQEDEDGNRGGETVVEVGPSEEDPTDDLIVDPTMSIPVLQQMTDEDTLVEGVATNDELSVILYVDGEEIARLTPDEFNSPFAYELENALPEGTVVAARHVNEEGVVSGEYQIIVTAAEEDDSSTPPIIIEVDQDGGVITGEVSDPTLPIIIDTGDEQFVVRPEADGSFTIDLDELGITGDVTIYQVDKEGVPGRSVTITRQEDGTTGVRYDSERPTVTDSDQFRIAGE